MEIFKKKTRDCPNCYQSYTGNEEKETDVNIALALLDLAYQDKYDRAILLTNDSDQVPSIKKVLQRFPDKLITLLIPPHTRECNELIQVATKKAKITKEHLQKCLLPETVFSMDKREFVNRPSNYNPVLAVV